MSSHGPLAQGLYAAVAAAQLTNYDRSGEQRYNAAAMAGLLLVVAHGNASKARQNMPYDDESPYWTAYWEAVEQHLRSVEVEERDRHQLSIPRT